MGNIKQLSWLSLPILVCAGVVAGPVAAADALTLEGYFSAALQRSETTGIQLEQVHQAEEHLQQANSAFLPTITGIASTTNIDPLPPSAPSTPSTLSQQSSSRITLSQPLFRGMSEYAALRQSRNLLAAQRQDYRGARLKLYKDVVQNFYSILALEGDIRNYKEEIRLNQEREQDVKARVRIGKSRDSELLNVQSTISTLQATIEQLRGQLLTAREAFTFMSGLDVSTAMRDTTDLPGRLEPLAGFLDGVQSRPDVQAAQERVIAATEAVAVVRGGHLPNLDLNANYYLQRPGYLNESKWDVTLSLTLPLYAGGTVQSRVREASAQRTQAELNRSLVIRQSAQEVRSLYQSVDLTLTQLQALQAATEAARKSYQAQLRDYRLGLVINLDVLQALTAYQQNQRTLDRAVYTARSNYLQLLASADRIPAMNLKP